MTSKATVMATEKPMKLYHIYEILKIHGMASWGSAVGAADVISELVLQEKKSHH